MEQRLLEILHELIEDTDDIGTNLSVLDEVSTEEFDDENSVYSFKLVGGRNGTGLWSNYFKSLAEFFDRLEAEFQDTFITDFEVDSLDDVFYATVSVVPYIGQLD